MKSIFSIFKQKSVFCRLYFV